MYSFLLKTCAPFPWLLSGAASSAKTERSGGGGDFDVIVQC